jgi:hypothetical protein
LNPIAPLLLILYVFSSFLFVLLDFVLNKFFFYSNRPPSPSSFSSGWKHFYSLLPFNNKGEIVQKTKRARNIFGEDGTDTAD